jgi:hypothetical protein
VPSATYVYYRTLVILLCPIFGDLTTVTH